MKTPGESYPRWTLRYTAWHHMLQRCYNTQRHDRKIYEGITVCERWHKFENFAEDMGQHPGKGWSLDRIDNAGHYEPENCRWATNAMQMQNRRLTKLTRQQVDEIRRRVHAGEIQRRVAERFKISPSHVCDIYAGNRWI